MPARTERCETAGAADLKRSRPPETRHRQHVRYFFDAFPYQRYGVVNAKLDWISPSAVSTTEGTHFVALGYSTAMRYSHRAGQVLPLRVGMGGEAHIVVGGRTMIEYAFEPIRQLRENMTQ